LFEGATLVNPPVVVVAGRKTRTETREMGRMRGGSEHLSRANVRAAEHSDLAAGVRKRRNPLYCVVTIFGLMKKGIPFPFRAVAAADILDDNDVTARGTLVEELDVRTPAQFVVGGALEEDRKFPFGIRTIDIRSKSDTVAHLGGNIVFHFDGKELGGQEPGGG